MKLQCKYSMKQLKNWYNLHLLSYLYLKTLVISLLFLVKVIKRRQRTVSVLLQAESQVGDLWCRIKRFSFFSFSFAYFQRHKEDKLTKKVKQEHCLTHDGLQINSQPLNMFLNVLDHSHKFYKLSFWRDFILNMEV